MVVQEIYGKRILFAVLNWGLGHATRSAVIIRQLLEQQNQVTLVSSGLAQHFLKAQFPELERHELPTREIVYPAHAHLWFNMLLQQKKIFGNIEQEKKMAAQLCQSELPDLIISDNCYGFFNRDIHSVLITHQVNVQAPFFEKMVQKKIHRLLQPFQEIWVPDFAGEKNLSGKLSHPVLPGKKFNYIGPLSEMNLQSEKSPPAVYDYCAIISGPEKQRTLFENKVIDFLLERKAPAILIRGTNKTPERKLPPYIHVEDLCFPHQVKTFMQQSHTVIGRTGYTTLMDLYLLQKSCILLPTPGQTEQEYLFAKHFGSVPRNLQNLQPRLISPCKG